MNVLQTCLLTLTGILSFTLIYIVVSDALTQRAAIIKECAEAELMIINGYNQENDKTYLNYYGQGSRQKVLGREGNLLVLNFKNQDQMLASSLKKEA